MSDSEFERRFRRYLEGPKRPSEDRSLNLVSVDGRGGVFIPDASGLTAEQIADIQAALDGPGKPA